MYVLLAFSLLLHITPPLAYYANIVFTPVFITSPRHAAPFVTRRRQYGHAHAIAATPPRGGYRRHTRLSYRPSSTDENIWPVWKRVSWPRHRHPRGECGGEDIRE